MIYEIRTYTLQPGGLEPWLELYESKALPVIAGIEAMKLVGYFYTEAGAAEEGGATRVVHLWSYPDAAAREAAHAALGASEAWTQGFVAAARPYLAMQEHAVLTPVAFSPLQ
jgi:hypothetical protein